MGTKTAVGKVTQGMKKFLEGGKRPVQTSASNLPITPKTPRGKPSAKPGKIPSKLKKRLTMKGSR